MTFKSSVFISWLSLNVWSFTYHVRSGTLFFCVPGKVVISTGKYVSVVYLHSGHSPNFIFHSKNLFLFMLDTKKTAWLNLKTQRKCCLTEFLRNSNERNVVVKTGPQTTSSYRSITSTPLTGFIRFIHYWSGGPVFIWITRDSPSARV